MECDVSPPDSSSGGGHLRTGSSSSSSGSSNNSNISSNQRRQPKHHHSGNNSSSSNLSISGNSGRNLLNVSTGSSYRSESPVVSATAPISMAASSSSSSSSSSSTSSQNHQHHQQQHNHQHHHHHHHHHAHHIHHEEITVTFPEVVSCTPEPSFSLSDDYDCNPLKEGSFPIIQISVTIRNLILISSFLQWTH